MVEVRSTWFWLVGYDVVYVKECLFVFTSGCCVYCKNVVEIFVES
jgi:hypothetical protein